MIIHHYNTCSREWTIEQIQINHPTWVDCGLTWLCDANNTLIDQGDEGYSILRYGTVTGSMMWWMVLNRGQHYFFLVLSNNEVQEAELNRLMLEKFAEDKDINEPESADVAAIRADFETWSGGFPPESVSQMHSYCGAARPVDSDYDEVFAILRAWMNEDGRRS